MARILVVDDSRETADLLCVLLSREGYEVQAAYSGKESLRALESTAFDLILLDLMMPGIDGFGVLSAMQGHPDWGEIPVIVLTAGAEPDVNKRALEAGAVDCIFKPVDVEALKQSIAALTVAQIS